MAKSFKHHLMESYREYNFRIKTLVKLDDSQMDKLERLLNKYDIKAASKMTKTIFQKNPLDFAQIDHGEVYIMDVALGLPASAYILQQEIRAELGLPENHIVVRTDSDPIEIENEYQAAQKEMEVEATKKGLRNAPRLSTDSQYPEDEQGKLSDPVYGNEYNGKFLQRLADVAASRVSNRVEPQNSLFSWLDHDRVDSDSLPDANEFNANIPGAPRVISAFKSKRKVSDKPVAPVVDTTETGGFAANREFTRAFVNDKGKRTVMKKGAK